MKKRILSLILVLAMALSLAACGSKDDKVNGKKSGSADASSVTDVVNEMSKTDNKGMVIEGSYAGMSGKLDITTNGKDSGCIKVVYEGKDVTDVIIVNDKIYFNIQTAAKFADDFMGSAQYVPMLQAINVNQTYMSFDKDELEDLSSTPLDYTQVENNDENTKLITATAKFLTDYAQSVNIDKDVVKIDGTYAEVSVDYNNVEGILNALKGGDPKKYLESYYNEIKDLKMFADEDTSNVDFDEAANSFKDEIQNALDNIDEIKATKFDTKVGFGVKSGNLTLEVKGSAEMEGQKQSASLKVTGNNNTFDGKAPESTISYTEFDSIINALN